jgi:hypothetical protein
MTNEELFQQAFQLPNDVRADLALQLCLTLETEDVPDPSVIKAWGEEAKRRLEMYERGELEMEDWNDVYQRMKAKLS